MNLHSGGPCAWFNALLLKIINNFMFELIFWGEPQWDNRAQCVSKGDTHSMWRPMSTGFPWHCEAWWSSCCIYDWARGGSPRWPPKSIFSFRSRTCVTKCKFMHPMHREVKQTKTLEAGAEKVVLQDHAKTQVACTPKAFLKAKWRSGCSWPLQTSWYRNPLSL